MPRMTVDLRVGESVSFNSDQIRVTLDRKDGQRARLTIQADESVRVVFPKRESSAAMAVQFGALRSG